jgi:hypothetical protein
VIENFLPPPRFEPCTPLRVRSKSDAHPTKLHALVGFN